MELYKYISTDTIEDMVVNLNETSIKIYLAMFKKRRYIGVDKLCDILGLENNYENKKYVSKCRRMLEVQGFIKVEIRVDKMGRESRRFTILKS